MSVPAHHLQLRKLLPVHELEILDPHQSAVLLWSQHLPGAFLPRLRLPLHCKLFHPVFQRIEIPLGPVYAQAELLGSPLAAPQPDSVLLKQAGLGCAGACPEGLDRLLSAQFR